MRTESKGGKTLKKEKEKKKKSPRRFFPGLEGLLAAGLAEEAWEGRGSFLCRKLLSAGLRVHANAQGFGCRVQRSRWAEVGSWSWHPVCSLVNRAHTA